VSRRYAWKCAHTPTLVCGGYESASGTRVKCGRVIRDGGGKRVEGQCRVCADLQKRAWAKKWARQSRELLERRRKGYGPAPDGEDVFAGFREEGE
jgi:hypothetical protein